MVTVSHEHAVQLPTPHFVAWTRRVGVRLPFPLNTREQEYVERPDAEALDRFLAAERLADDPALDAARRAFARPALAVFAVRGVGGTPDAPETKYVAICGREPDSSAMIVLDTATVSVRAVPETALAASVALAVPLGPPSPFAAFESTSTILAHAEDVCLSDASPRTRRTALNATGLPPAFIAVREHIIGRPRTGVGLVSATAFDEAGEGRPAARAGIWIEAGDVAYLQVALPARGTTSPVLVSPVTADHVFRAATEAIASCYPPNR